MFARLLLRSADIADDDLTLIKRFVVFLYDRIGSAASVKGAHRWLFTAKGRSVDNSLPTLNVPLQHIYCSILQCVAGAKLQIYSNFWQIEVSLGGMVLLPYG